MPPLIDSSSLPQILTALGQAVANFGVSRRISIVFAGSAAGILGGLFKPGRRTGDCDVIQVDEVEWQVISRAAAEVAQSLGLAQNWLNRECRSFAWCLPLGWHDRCEHVGGFGPLDVYRLSRFDLLGAKLVAGTDRTHDLIDLRDLNPSLAELDQLEAHLDRLQSEHLDNDPFQSQRDILDELRGRA